MGNIALTYALAFFVVLFFELPSAAILKTRESTIVHQDFLPKQVSMAGGMTGGKGKGNSYTVNPAGVGPTSLSLSSTSAPTAPSFRNGVTTDMEMAKKDGKEIVMHRL